MTRRLLAAIVLLFAPAFARADVVRVAAAISMKDALGDVAAKVAAHGDTVEFVFGASGALLSQIRNGADVDLFVSAAEEQVDALAKDGLIDVASRRVIAGNRLVLVVPAGADAPRSFAELATGVTQRLAIGEPKTVPAGMYAAAALKSLRLADATKDKLVYGTNVRQVLSYVERGEVSAGLIYATDARQAGDKVRVVATAPEASHAPIVYPAAILKNAKNRAAAERFLAVATSDEGRAIFAARGFTAAPATQAVENCPEHTVKP